MMREEHLAWAKQRALEYVDLFTREISFGQIASAVVSLISDLDKHEETRELITPARLRQLTQAALDDAGEMRSDAPRVRRWIEKLT
jgi:hypothetical protein